MSDIPVISKWQGKCHNKTETYTATIETIFESGKMHTKIEATSAATYPKRTVTIQETRDYIYTGNDLASAILMLAGALNLSQDPSTVYEFGNKHIYQITNGKIVKWA